MKVNEQVEAPRPARKRTLVTAFKLVLSLAILGEIYRRVLMRDGAQEVFGHLGRLNWGWISARHSDAGRPRRHRALAPALGGQGIHAPWSFSARPG